MEPPNQDQPFLRCNPPLPRLFVGVKIYHNLIGAFSKTMGEERFWGSNIVSQVPIDMITRYTFRICYLGMLILCTMNCLTGSTLFSLLGSVRELAGTCENGDHKIAAHHFKVLIVHVPGYIGAFDKISNRNGTHNGIGFSTQLNSRTVEPRATPELPKCSVNQMAYRVTAPLNHC